MLSLEKLLESTDNQMLLNSDKSIFYEKNRSFEISDKIYSLLLNDFDKLIEFMEENLEETDLIISKIAEKAAKTFEKANQYILFYEKDILILKKIYWNLILELKKESKNSKNFSKEKIKIIIQNHHENLKQFLIFTNGEDLFIKYRSTPKIPLVVNEEYSEQLQFDILQLDFNPLHEPIIDIGCGEHFKLVKFLKQKKINVYGLDRVENDSNFIIKNSWMDYKFQKNQWGTVISHMAFSNHFNHHNSRKDGNYKEFMIKYMEILESLKVNGTFVYSPKLPFIEEIIKKYKSNEYKVSEYEFSVHIQRIK